MCLVLFFLIIRKTKPTVLLNWKLFEGFSFIILYFLSLFGRGGALFFFLSFFLSLCSPIRVFFPNSRSNICLRWYRNQQWVWRHKYKYGVTPMFLISIYAWDFYLYSIVYCTLITLKWCSTLLGINLQGTSLFYFI